MATAVTLKLLPNDVAVITFDLPDSKVNVLSTSLMAELDAALDQVAAVSRDLKGLVFISGKEDNFFAGANLEEIVTLQNNEAGARAGVDAGKKVFAKIAALRFPTVAAINGVCLGGGLELALACTYRLASDSPKTKLGLPEVGLGFLPGWGGCVRLPKLIGAQAALDIILQPLRSVDSKKAWRIGLVDEIVPADSLLERAQTLLNGVKPKRASAPVKVSATRWFMDRTFVGRKLLNKFASQAIRKETKGNFPAPPAVLKVVLAALTQPADKAFDLESRLFAQLATTDVSRNLVGIFFATQEAKKAPLNAVPTIKIQKVGVAGAGVMGAGIAQAALYAGYTVVLFDKFQGGLDKGLGTIKGLYAGLVEKGKLTQTEVDAHLARLTTSTDSAAFAGCDLVIEAIIEDMGAKKAFIAELDKVVGKPYIFATNTSSLSVSEMVSEAATPANAGGLHFFNPVHKMPLVEVIAGEKTSPATIAALKAFAGKVGKTAVTSADSPGFIVNRILAPYMYESIVLMEEGVPLADIDDAMKRFGMPMGPLALLDEVGLDIGSKVLHVLNDAFGARLTPPKILDFIAAQKLLGKKGGKGIYLYDETGKRGDFNPDLVAALNATAKPMSRQAIQDRLVMAMVSEAVRCLEEHVTDDPSQLDLAMIMGTGFPPFRGGLLRYADSIGAAAVVQKLDWMTKVAGENFAPSALLREKAQSGQRFYR